MNTFGIFDQDGTLFDSENPLYELCDKGCEEVISERFNIPRSEILDLSTRPEGASVTNAITQWEKENPEKSELAEAYRQLYTEGKPVMYQEKVLPYIEVPEAVEALLEISGATGIGTQSEKEIIDILRAKYPWYDRLTNFGYHAVGGNPEKRRKKPSPDIYNTLMERMGALGPLTFGVEDSKTGVEALLAARDSRNQPVGQIYMLGRLPGQVAALSALDSIERNRIEVLPTMKDVIEVLNR